MRICLKALNIPNSRTSVIYSYSAAFLHRMRVHLTEFVLERGKFVLRQSNVYVTFPPHVPKWRAKVHSQRGRLRSNLICTPCYFKYPRLHQGTIDKRKSVRLRPFSLLISRATGPINEILWYLRLPLSKHVIFQGVTE